MASSEAGVTLSETLHVLVCLSTHGLDFFFFPVKAKA